MLTQQWHGETKDFAKGQLSVAWDRYTRYRRIKRCYKIDPVQKYFKVVDLQLKTGSILLKDRQTNIDKYAVTAYITLQNIYIFLIKAQI